MQCSHHSTYIDVIGVWWQAIRWVKLNKIDTQVKIQQDILNEAKYSGLDFAVNIKGPMRKYGGCLGWQK
jgi:hypothetical protein